VVFGDRGAHALEVPVQDANQQDRLDALAERGKAHQIGKQDRDFLLLTDALAAIGDDPLDDVVGSKAAEGHLKPLQFESRSLQALAQRPSLSRASRCHQAERDQQCDRESGQ
jgi:hypothetical protein